MATSIDPFFQFPNFPEDGVLGWGFKETSIAGADSYFTSLVNFGGPSNGDPVFGFRMTPSQTGAELVIGGRDTSKFSGNLTYIKLSTPPVSILRGVPCLRLTQSRYRVFGRSRWILSHSTELPLSPLSKQFLTRVIHLLLVTMRLSPISIAISPVPPMFQAPAYG